MTELSNNPQTPESEPQSIPLMDLRGLPIAQHVYLFGAAIMGYGVGVGVQDTTAHSLVPMTVGCALCITGYWLFRPYKKLAKRGIAQLADRRMQAVAVDNSAEVNDDPSH
jgi:hypothetical protein